MNRPYITCHILSSIDGKITGEFMKSTTTKEYAKHYAKIRDSFQADAWAYGSRTTMEFLANQNLQLKQQVSPVPTGDFVAENNAKMYYVSLDTEGRIPWESGTFRKKGRPDSHVIEIVLESTPKEYLAHLRAISASYVIAGKDSLDCELAMEKLYQLFNIKKILICGGGGINWTFLKQGCMDELSLVVAPIVDGGNKSISIFEQTSINESNEEMDFSIKKCDPINEKGLWLLYQVTKVK